MFEAYLRTLLTYDPDRHFTTSNLCLDSLQDLQQLVVDLALAYPKLLWLSNRIGLLH